VHLQTVSNVNNGAWVRLNSKTCIIPKDDRLGIMISAFYSQEFSFGLNLSNKQCNQINEVWKGQQYVDIRAAIEMKKNAQQLKLDLTEFPFIKKK